MGGLTPPRQGQGDRQRQHQGPANHLFGAHGLRHARTPGIANGSGGHGAQQQQIKILLVTSAFHMQRSKTLFERAGFKVEPFAVDFKVSQAKVLSVLDFMPNADALQQTETAWRELYGRAYYALLKK